MEGEVRFTDALGSGLSAPAPARSGNVLSLTVIDALCLQLTRLLPHVSSFC